MPTEVVRASVTQLQPGRCRMSGWSYSVKTSGEPRAKKLASHDDGRWGTDRTLELTWKHLQLGPHPSIFHYFYSRKLFSFRKPGCPKLYLTAHTPRVLPYGAVHRLAGKSHKAAVEPSHRKSLLKQQEELQKANSVSTEKKLILCSCLNKLYSFPSGTFIPVYSTTSEII